MTLDILTPELKVFSGEVYAVNLPGTEGGFEVLEKHAPLVSNLSKGYVTIRKTAKDKDEEKFLIEGGIIEVLNNKVVVLADAVLKQ
ncbi:MAG TPA: ATP synthase F1 subunit epsilon [Cytophagaceae bacterium]|jgi:F-type H+-transporting ATPase subunit epsilon|nr:ATP synthase F1 subunit epsilon [Cytophagaceae bacterium]